jgi:hypothetical protein
MIDIREHGGVFGGNSKKVLSIEKVATYNSAHSLFNNRILYKNRVIYGIGPSSSDFSRIQLDTDTRTTRTINPITDYLRDGDYIFVLSKGAYLYKLDLDLNIITQVADGSSDRLALGNNYLYALDVTNRKIHKIDKNTLSIVSTITLPVTPITYGYGNVSFAVDESAGIAAYRDTNSYIKVVNLSDGSLLASFTTLNVTLIGLFFTRVDAIPFLNVLIQDGSNYYARLYRYRMTDYVTVLDGASLDPRAMAGYMYGVCRLYGDIFLTVDNGHPIVIYPSAGTLNYSRALGSSADQIATDGDKIVTHEYYYTRYLYDIKWR